MSSIARSARWSFRSLRFHFTKPLATISSILEQSTQSVSKSEFTLQLKVLTNPFYQARPFSSSKAPKKSTQRGFVPRKAALNLTPSARKFCKLLLKNAPEDVKGIILKYQMSSAGDMRMVFSLSFARLADIGPDDEGVSLEVLEDGSPKPPKESDLDNMPKLYIHGTAFMKVLGGTMDIDIQKDGSFEPTFTDREGNHLDPNN